MGDFYNPDNTPLAEWERDLLDLPPTITEPTTRDYKVVAEFLMYHMGMDIRGKLMNELPNSYNRIIGRNIVKVVRESDHTRIGG